MIVGVRVSLPGFHLILPDATIYSLLDNKNFSLTWGQIVALRTWMEAHGQKDKPLIITEYGVLFPAWVLCDTYPVTTGCPFTPEQVRDNYMYPSFDKFLIGQILQSDMLRMETGWSSAGTGIARMMIMAIVIPMDYTSHTAVAPYSTQGWDHPIPIL